MITLRIQPAKSRFGIRPRKQWRWSLIAANGEPLDPRDTLANPGDIVDTIQAIRHDDITVETHYPDGVRKYVL